VPEITQNRKGKTDETLIFRIGRSRRNKSETYRFLRRKHLGDISYTRRVVVDFVLNFGCHGNGFGCGRICL